MTLTLKPVDQFKFHGSKVSFHHCIIIRSSCLVLNKRKNIRIIHSDRCSQYTSNRYRKLLKQYSVQSSYSKSGYPYDNAIIESYHAALKIEWLYRQKFQTIEDLNKAVFKYNYGFYNNKRIHQGLGYSTPSQAEIKYIELN